MIVDGDAAALVARDAGGFEAEAVGVGAPADGDEDDVGVEALRRPAGGRVRPRPSATLPFFSTEATLLDRRKVKPWRVSRRWACFATSPSIPGRTRSRNSTTVTSEPSRRQTEPSSRPMTPAPMTTRRCGTSVSVSAPVEVTTRVSSISTPFRGEDSEPVAMTIALASIVCASPFSGVTVTLPGAAIEPGADERIDLVLLEEVRDAVDARLHHRILVGLHRREIELRRADLDAERLEAVAGEIEHLGGVEERLRRDAADVQAGAAEGRALLDDRDLEAKLGGLDGADVAAGAGADDGEIVGGCQRKMLPHEAVDVSGEEIAASAAAVSGRSAHGCLSPMLVGS